MPFLGDESPQLSLRPGLAFWSWRQLPAGWLGRLEAACSRAPMLPDPGSSLPPANVTCIMELERALVPGSQHSEANGNGSCVQLWLPQTCYRPGCPGPGLTWVRATLLPSSPALQGHRRGPIQEQRPATVD